MHLTQAVVLARAIAPTTLRKQIAKNFYQLSQVHVSFMLKSYSVNVDGNDAAKS